MSLAPQHIFARRKPKFFLIIFWVKGTFAKIEKSLQKYLENIIRSEKMVKFVIS